MIKPIINYISIYHSIVFRNLLLEFKMKIRECYFPIVFSASMFKGQHRNERLFKSFFLSNSAYLIIKYSIMKTMKTVYNIILQLYQLNFVIFYTLRILAFILFSLCFLQKPLSYDLYNNYCFYFILSRALEFLSSFTTIFHHDKISFINEIFYTNYCLSLFLT